MFPKLGSLKGCFRNVKAQGSHIDLKRMSSSGVSFGCDSDLLVKTSGAPPPAGQTASSSATLCCLELSGIQTPVQKSSPTIGHLLVLMDN